MRQMEQATLQLSTTGDSLPGIPGPCLIEEPPDQMSSGVRGMTRQAKLHRG